jgi:predicted nucleic acid-binding protein
VTGTVRLCRDPDDDILIETARAGRADELVTRDDDLKSDWDLVQLLHSEGIEVVSVTRFLRALNA